MLKQRLLALLLVVLSGLAMWYMIARCPGEDATGALVIGVFGLYGLFTRTNILYRGGDRHD